MNGETIEFDTGDNYTLLEGGYNLQGSLSDTWRFGALGWSQIPAQPGGPALNLAGSAYDAADGYAVVFGGNTNGASNTGGTYTYSGGAWSALSPPTAPSGRANPSMAYDAADSYVVLFGGCGPANTGSACTLNGDTWKFSGGSWTQLRPPTSPSARFDSAFAYDPAIGAVVLFGGCTASVNNVCQTLSSQTWEFKGGRWSHPSFTSAPPARYGASMVYDPKVGGLVLFGGAVINGSVLNDTWEFKGSSWVKLSTSPSPPGRFRVQLAYDPNIGGIVVFGGYTLANNFLGDTWVFGSQVPAFSVDSDFTLPGTLDTSKWALDSPAFADMVNADAAAWGLNASVGVPQLPISGGAGGLAFNISGVQSMAGVTSSYYATPPFNATVSVAIGASTGGSPAFVCIGNEVSTSFVCVFLANQVFIQNGTVTPTAAGGLINGGSTYTVSISMQFSSLSIQVPTSSGTVSWSGGMPASTNQSYALTLGGFAGVFPGQTTASTYAESSNFLGTSLTFNHTWTLSVSTIAVTAKGVRSTDPGVAVSLFNEFIDPSTPLANSSSNLAGKVSFANLVSGLYLVTASQSQAGTPQPVVASSLVFVGGASNPVSSTVTATLFLAVPTIQKLVASLAVSPATSGNAPFTSLSTAIAGGGTSNYTYAWTLNGATAGSNSSAFPQVFTTAGTYTVSVTVTCWGRWFSQTCVTLKAATASTVLEVNANHYNITLVHTAGYGAFALTSPINGTSDEAALQVGNGLDQININAVLAFEGLTIPPSISSILGISSPWYDISLNDSIGTTVDTGVLIQLDTLPPVGIVSSLPTGTPTTRSGGLQLLPLNFTASFTNRVALALDIVSIIAGLLPVPKTYAEEVALAYYLVNFDTALLFQLLNDPIGGITTTLNGIVTDVQSFVLGASGVALSNWKSTILDALHKPLTVADLTFDVTSMLGAFLFRQTIWDQYTLQVYP